MKSVVIISLIVLAFATQDDTKFDLGGSDWKVKNNSMQPINAVVPGQIHTDLMAANLIDEPFYGFNDEYYRWKPYRT